MGSDIILDRSNEKDAEQMFVTDLDGTLLNDDKTISKPDLDTLYSLQNKNIITVIATGRSNFSFMKLMTGLGYCGAERKLPIDYVIFSTGAGIMLWPSGRIIKTYALSENDVLKITEPLEEYAIDYMVHREVPDTRSFVYRHHGQVNPDFTARLALYGKYGKPINNMSLKDFGRATEVLCIVPADKGHELAAKIMAQLNQYSVIKATSPLDNQSIWIEIFSPQVSKSSAVGFLADKLGIDRANVCAVGNDYNDEDLLRWAGNGYAVANSASPIKKRFFNVESNNHCGVSSAARLWLGLSKVE